MKTIWKSIIQPDVVQTLLLPKGSKPLYVGWQSRSMCLWYEVPDTDAETEGFPIYVIGTGEETPNTNAVYIGSVQVPGAAIPLVFHIYTDPV